HEDAIDVRRRLARIDVVRAVDLQLTDRRHALPPFALAPSAFLSLLFAGAGSSPPSGSRSPNDPAIASAIARAPSTMSASSWSASSTPVIGRASSIAVFGEMRGLPPFA